MIKQKIDPIFFQISRKILKNLLSKENYGLKIAKDEGLNISGVSKSLDFLVDSGLIIQIPTECKRIKLFSLTPEGRIIALKLKEVEDIFNAKV